MAHRTLTIRWIKSATTFGTVLTFTMALFGPRTSHADEDLPRLPAIALSTIQLLGSHNSYKSGGRFYPSNC